MGCCPDRNQGGAFRAWVECIDAYQELRAPQSHRIALRYRQQLLPVSALPENALHAPRDRDARADRCHERSTALRSANWPQL